MKKLFVLGLVALIPFTLAGCGSKTEQPEIPVEEINTGEFEIVEYPDAGFDEVIEDTDTGVLGEENPVVINEETGDAEGFIIVNDVTMDGSDEVQVN